MPAVWAYGSADGRVGWMSANGAVWSSSERETALVVKQFVAFPRRPSAVRPLVIATSPSIVLSLPMRVKGRGQLDIHHISMRSTL